MQASGKPKNNRNQWKNGGKLENLSWNASNKIIKNQIKKIIEQKQKLED